MHELPKYLQWVEAERRAVEAARAFFEAALDLEPDPSGTAPDADEVAALRDKADACYLVAMAGLAEFGERSADGEVTATNQLATAEFVLLPAGKTVN